MIWIETLSQFPNENGADFVQIGIEESLLRDLELYCLAKLWTRYYYAVVECDLSATADYLYKSCDGTEFERSSNKLDLRFIPDSMEFKHPPQDIATELGLGDVIDCNIPSQVITDGCVPNYAIELSDVIRCI
uniref:ESF1 RRM domain-containing protein n=1 Tax=Fagus sylvatica TaxID=28930 RepID=A0A2N9IGS4_FAGSY